MIFILLFAFGLIPTITKGLVLKFTTLIVLVFCYLQSPYVSAGEPEILESRGVKYVSGGMNEAERKKMDRLASRFPIHMVITSTAVDGPIAGALVKVKDLSGDVILEEESKGPLFFVEVVSGRYTIEATYNGQTLTETKDLTGRRYLRLRFKFTQ